MKIQVEMLRFGKPDEIRVVDVPDAEFVGLDEDKLERVFFYGQNDFQPQNHPSVSVGDVVRLGNKRFRVGTMGFEEVDEAKAANKAMREALEHLTDFVSFLGNGNKSPDPRQLSCLIRDTRPTINLLRASLRGKGTEPIPPICPKCGLTTYRLGGFCSRECERT